MINKFNTGETVLYKDKLYIIEALQKAVYPMSMLYPEKFDDETHTYRYLLNMKSLMITSGFLRKI